MKNQSENSCVLRILYDKYIYSFWIKAYKTKRGIVRHKLPVYNMADILRVTTPLINKNQAPEMKRSADMAVQFPLQDTTRVNKPSSQSELLQQNNAMVGREDTSALLLNLLKDPSVTVNFLKSISSMEALIRLLPANNSPFTQEIEQMFGNLLIPVDQIAAEMERQENASTFFKGELFEQLRQALKQYPEQAELRQATVSFLKALTLFYTRQEALGSVANSLRFLSESLAPSKALSHRLEELSGRYLSKDAPEHFKDLRQETLDLLKEIGESILFSDKIDKVLKMVVYNLSRYNDNGDYLQEALSRLLGQLHGDEQRERLLHSLDAFLQQAGQPKERENTAMDVLTRILQQQAGNRELMILGEDKMEKIIHSLLSSPCNFTPLLHCVLPIQYLDMHSFAEIWINPNGEEDDRENPKSGKQSIHMLLSFDIEGIGRFELELFVREKVINFSLYCPPAYVSSFAQIQDSLYSCTGQTGYQIGELRVERLERPRSLMDVFRSLPYKRMGVDVKI